MILDQIDLALLAALEADGRKSFTTLAEEVGLSKTPCWNRIQALEEAGVLAGYAASVEPRALGLGVRAYIEVMIDPLKMKEFEEAALKNAYIISCHATAGSADYIMIVLCRNVDELDNTLRFNISKMPGLQRSSTIICLKTIKSKSSVVTIVAGDQKRRQKGNLHPEVGLERS